MLILAPMQGLTEVLFRKAYYSVFPDGFDLAISPFISLTAIDKMKNWLTAGLQKLTLITTLKEKDRIN